MVEDSIVRETVVAAPVQRVWEVLTQAEYVGRWFGADKAEIDLRPGGSFVMTWAEHGVGLARVERVEETRRCSASAGRWSRGSSRSPGEETLVEFTLAEKGDGTLLRVVESGFSKLDRPAEKQEWHRERNVDGWRQVLEAVARSTSRGLTLADPGPVFAALADPTRRSVLTRLAARRGGERDGAGARAAGHPAGGGPAPRRARRRGPDPGAPARPGGAARGAPGGPDRGRAVDDDDRRGSGTTAWPRSPRSPRSPDRPEVAAP